MSTAPIGKAGQLFREWPPEWGGRGAEAEEVRAANQVWVDIGYAGTSEVPRSMVAEWRLGLPRSRA